MRFLLSLVIALGVTITVGGLLSFVFGLIRQGYVHVHGFGPLDGDWSNNDYCFLGALLASVGSGLITVGGLNRGSRV